MKLFLLIPIFGVLASCWTPTSQVPPPVPDKNPKSLGEFSVERLETPSSRNVDLGSYTIDSTQSVSFILKNVGTDPITGISTSVNLHFSDKPDEPLSSADERVRISPDSSVGFTLDPEGTSNVSKLIRLDINHGMIAGKYFSTSIIDPDFTGFTVHISGTASDASTVSTDLDVTTNINLASFDLYEDSACTIPANFWYVGSGMVNYKDPPSLSTIYNKNTGNVPIYIAELQGPSAGYIPVVSTVTDYSVAGWTKIGVGEVFVPTFTNGQYIFKINTDGTILDTRNGHKYMSATSSTTLIYFMMLSN